MEFTLHYRGPLKAASQRKKRKDHKHCLRRHFHNQLKELWKLPQLSEFQDALLVPEPEVAESHTLLRRVGQYHFAPLIGSYFRLVASLERVMNFGENRIQMRIRRLAWSPAGPRFPHSQAIPDRVHNSL